MSLIKVFESNREIDRVFLGDGAIEIGRDIRSRIHLPDGDISTRHGKIVPDERGYRYVDQGSTNGSQVNGSSVNEHRLQEGDVIRLGDYELLFTENSPGTAPYSGSERTMAVGFDNAMLEAANREALFRRGGDRPGSWLETLIPSSRWLRTYSREDLQPDLLAGLTIAALLIPQGMAYALLAGLPPVHGLYASILPLLLYAFFGTSRHLAVGPVALDSLLVGAGIGAMAQSGTSEYIQLAVMLTLMIGIFQLVMGSLKLGFVVNFLSKPVLTGFTMAAAIIITVSQMNNLLGLQLSRSPTFFDTVLKTIPAMMQPHLWSAAIGIGGIIVLKLARQFRSPIPGPVVLLIIGTLLSWLIGFNKYGVAVVGEVPSGLPGFELLLPDQAQFVALLPLAFTLACVGFIEALSSGKNYAAQFGYRIDADAEFRALGLANLSSSVSGGFPVTGGLSRTAVNVNAGARTQLASIVSGIMVMLSVAFLTPLFYHVPIPILASIIVFSVVGLINIAEFRYLMAVKPLEISVLLTTLLVTLAYGFTTGLLSGLLAALIAHIVIQTRPNITLLGRLPQTSIFRSIANHPEAEQIEGITILRIDASFYFANVEFLQKTIAELTETPNPPRIILLDASAINDLDSSGDTIFRIIYRDLNRKNIKLYIAGLKSPVRDVLTRSGLYQEIGGQYFFYSVEAAIKRIETIERNQ